MSRIIPFSEVKEGQMFRILRPDVVGDRQVENTGLYMKVSATIAVDIAHDNKDIIPTFKIPCRIVESKIAFDPKKLETWQICHRKPH